MPRARSQGVPLVALQRSLTISDQPDDPSPVPPVPALTRSRRRVLVAEDDPALRRLIVTVLDDAGYEVTEAADGPQLLECIERLLAGHGARSDSFVVVTDVNMPGLTGLD